jgi:hypothetical protein
MATGAAEAGKNSVRIITMAAFFVSVKGAPGCSAAAQSRAVEEVQRVLPAFLPTAAAAAVHAPLQIRELAHRGAFLALLPAGACAARVHAGLVAAIQAPASTAVEARPGFRYVHKMLPMDQQLTAAVGQSTEDALAQAVSDVLEAGCAHTAGGSEGAAGVGSVAVMVHRWGDDNNTAGQRAARDAQPMLSKLAVRDAVLTATAARGYSVRLSAPTLVVVATMWREASTEHPRVGVAVVPGDTVRTSPKLGPIKLPLPSKPATNPKLSERRRKRPRQPHGPSATATPAPVRLSHADAEDLLSKALQRRQWLMMGVGTAAAAAANTGSSDGGCTTCFRLVHGTGDGFDGLTADFLGLSFVSSEGAETSAAAGVGVARVLVEAHHRWAEPEPLVAALRSAAAAVDGALASMLRRCGGGGGGAGRLAIWLKQRWAADSRQSGTLLAADGSGLAQGGTRSGGGGGVSGGQPQKPEEEVALGVEGRLSTEVVCQEHGLSFALSLCKGEHIGLFLDSRPARAAVRRLAHGRRVLNLFAFTGVSSTTSTQSPKHLETPPPPPQRHSQSTPIYTHSTH